MMLTSRAGGVGGVDKKQTEAGVGTTDITDITQVITGSDLFRECSITLNVLLSM